MDQRISFITLAVRDLGETRRFYLDGLGWEPAPGGGVPPITISHNLATVDGVDRVLEHAQAAGAPQVTEARQRDWGGYSGYFVDADGFRWRSATTPPSSDRRCCHE